MDPFEGYKVYGPTYHKRINRYMIFLVSPSHRTSMTYARYLMSMHLGRRLEPWEYVDHIDNNQLNDVIENLQILTHAENLRKYALTKPSQARENVDMVCPQCGECFTMTLRTLKARLANSPHKEKEDLCCSRSCGNRYSHAKSSTDIVHGTYGGYRKELYHKLTPCTACRAASAAYHMKLKAKRQ